MINLNNYESEIKKIGIQNLNATQKEAHEQIISAKKDGIFEDLMEDSEYAGIVQAYINTLKPIEPKAEKPKAPKKEKKNDFPEIIELKEGISFINMVEKTFGKENIDYRKSPISFMMVYLKDGRSYSFVNRSKWEDGEEKAKFILNKEKKEEAPKKEKKPKEKEPSRPSIELELSFIKRYANMHKKKQNKDAILRFVKQIQRAITQRKITKKSELAEQIMHVQKELVKLYNSKDNTFVFELDEKDRKILGNYIKLAKITPKNKAYMYIKRYIGLQGQAGVTDKAEKLLALINKAKEQGYIKDDDQYIEELNIVISSLERYIAGEDQVITLKENDFAGLNGLSGLSTVLMSAAGISAGLTLKERIVNPLLEKFDKNRNRDNTITTAKAINTMDFKTIGLQGQFFELFGDPSPNFTMLMYGSGGHGKSTAALMLADTLATMGMKALFVAKEEGISKTLQEKIKRLEINNDNLIITPSLPISYKDYDLVIIDSIQSADFDEKDLINFKAKYPNKAIILVGQVTKEGIYKGNKSIEHEVDIVIRVENGIATQEKGRFKASGSSIKIFDY